MPQYRFQLTLTLRGPILTKSSEPGQYGIDAPFAQDEEGRFYLPGTQVKGRVREAFEELHRECGDLMPDPASWFGPSAQQGGNRKNPGGDFQRHNTRIFFSDFVHKEEPTHEKKRRGRRWRVAIDETLHAAKEGQLQLMESPFRAGETAKFEGTITLDAPSAETEEYVKYRLIKALRWAGCLGANVSVGFGRITNIQVQRAAAEAETARDPAPQSDQIHLRLATEDLLCVTESRGAENLFVSGSQIPGGVIKGAIAAQWMRQLGKPGCAVEAECDPERGELAQWFQWIRVSHAKPVPEGQGRLPVEPPLSYAKVGEQFRDLALEPRPEEFDDPVTYSPDWKHEDERTVDGRFGRHWPPTELRVRTAIESSKRKARDEALFAYEMVRSKGYAWYATIDLSSAGETAPAVRQQLVGLLSDGIRGVGKTKARLRVEVLEAPPERFVGSRAEAVQGQYVVTLQTAAILADPRILTGSRSEEVLLRAYREVFHELSDGGLYLERFFARQFLQGGIYLYKRFQQGRVNGEGQAMPYEPYLLTRAGSVFVLTVADEKKARGHIQRWRVCGLPVPEWAKKWYARNGKDGAHWSNLPYTPENGYGEIAVNLDVHFGGEESSGNDPMAN